MGPGPGHSGSVGVPDPGGSSSGSEVPILGGSLGIALGEILLWKIGVSQLLLPALVLPPPPPPGWTLFYQARGGGEQAGG